MIHRTCDFHSGPIDVFVVADNRLHIRYRCSRPPYGRLLLHGLPVSLFGIADHRLLVRRALGENAFYWSNPATCARGSGAPALFPGSGTASGWTCQVHRCGSRSAAGGRLLSRCRHHLPASCGGLPLFRGGERKIALPQRNAHVCLALTRAF